MARPFSYPAVKQLEIGQSVTVPGTVGQVCRRVFAYGKRAGKTFLVSPPEKGEAQVTVLRIEPPLAVAA